MRKKYKRFLLTYLTFLLAFSIPILMNLIFIHHAYENSPFFDIAGEQQKENAIYGTALNQNTFSYKLELVRWVKPEVITLGSSRVLELREEFFHVRFMNCGGAMNQLNEGRMFLEKMVTFHKPKLVLLGIDFWWFSETNRMPERYDYHQNDGATLTFEKITKPFIYLFQSKLSLKQYFSVLFLKDRKNGVTNYDNMGLRAIRDSDGFRKDGSALYGGTIFSFTPSAPRKIDFLNFGNEKASPSRGFNYQETFLEKRVEELNRMIKLCRDFNIDLVLFLPPISRAAYKRFFSMPDIYQFVQRLEGSLSMSSKETYNFHNILDIGSNDCECIDSVHIGDVAYQRLLLTLLKKNPNTCMKDYLNVERMEAAIHHFSGKTLTIFKNDEEKFNLPEIDFLKMGCRK